MRSALLLVPSLRTTLSFAALLCSAPLIAQSPATTAWQDGIFHINTGAVVSRSDIILGRPNMDASEAMPLGNGRLGIVVWSADGFTAQLNRADTLPHRLSPGQVVIPGLAKLTAASDYAGRLDLYNGAFIERGGGMSATVYTQPRTDALSIDVTGADPAQPQTATLRLWEPRAPKASVHGDMGILAESWLDDKDPGASGRRFGSLSAITAEGRHVSATVTDARSITLTVTPTAAGAFRIIVAAPHYAGTGAVTAIAGRASADRNAAEHVAWWHAFWHRAALLKISSYDGAGEYMENLRNIYLFSAAAENGDEFPGSQAGVGDLFSSVRDAHQWDPSAYWHWNLRMQVAANLAAGLPELNLPYFRLYRDNLAAIEQWTRERMDGRPGICVPETMRFNGRGIEYELWSKPANQPSGLNCDAGSPPYYNARTLSTGAEVSLWIWQQYLATHDRSFLAANFPVMVASARFLLAYEKPGPDGMRHTSPSNAHETQWDVTDPTTDLAARKALYAATVEAAKTLAIEPALASELKSALSEIPDFPRTQFPRTQTSGKLTLLPAGADADGNDVIATSYRPEAEIRNVENIGLEPVWPYSLIGDTSPLFALAQRTFRYRPNRGTIDWSFDPIQAARLHLGSEVSANLIQITKANQRYVNGFARWGGNGKEFYVEQTGVVAAALPEAIVQDYDGMLRIAPAIPPGWNFDGTVSTRDKTRVDVQIHDGVPVTVGLEVAYAHSVQLRNPWPGAAIRVVDARTGRSVATTPLASAQDAISFAALAGHVYLVERASQPPLPFAAISGSPAITYRQLGDVQIGLAPAKAQ